MNRSDQRTPSFLLLPPGGSRYFGVSEIGRDRASEYASRQSMTLEEAEKWLVPNLAYDPENDPPFTPYAGDVPFCRHNLAD